MSLHLNFEPDFWYMDFAIHDSGYPAGRRWHAYIANGNNYAVDELESGTVRELKTKIRDYHLRKHNGYGERIAKRRLEYLREELEAGKISYGELVESQNLVSYIKEGDVQLLEAAGVPES